MHDVARAAGVSIKTVSRVVNGSDQVALDTRDRVLSAVATLGYVRDPIAHSLRTGSSDTIGIIIDSIADRFFSLVASEVEERALARGISVLIASTGRSPERELGQVSRLLQQNIDALVLAPNLGDHRYLRDGAGHLPIVLIDRGWELPGYDTVRVEDREGAKAATTHLVAYGHRRIGFLGEDDQLETITARRLGYFDGLQDSGIDVDPALMAPGCSTAAEANLATRALLDSPAPPTAIFASNPRVAMGVVSALHHTHRLDVALVSFGDFDLADSVFPAVTVIEQDPRQIAQAAVDRAFARMAKEDLIPTDITLPVELIARGSGELSP